MNHDDLGLESMRKLRNIVILCGILMSMVVATGLCLSGVLP